MTQPDEAEDVLEFLNSLPETDTNSGIGSTDVNTTTADDSDFLDFLDELALHETKKRPTGKLSAKTTVPVKDQIPKGKDEVQLPILKETKPIVSSESAENSGDKSMTETADANKNEPDLISSLSNWWSSGTASNIWDSIATNAHSLSEQTFQLASNTTNQLNVQRQKFVSEFESECGDGAEPPILGAINLMFNSILSQIKQGLISDDDELLNVFLVYDMSGITGLDQTAYKNLTRVTRQVEGEIRVNVTNFNHIRSNSMSSPFPSLKMFYGKTLDGEKLCVANLELAAQDYAKHVTAEPSSDKLFTTSTIFISIQPISTHVVDDSGFVSRDDDKPVLIESSNPQSFSFTVYLKDVTNGITVVTKTQPFPLQWAKWLDGEILSLKVNLDEGEINSQKGQVDPSVWVSEWIYRGLDLSLGVVAQEYIIKRMGI